MIFRLRRARIFSVLLTIAVPPVYRRRSRKSLNIGSISLKMMS